MKEKITENYISLLEATKHCKYSQPYLNLRIRQGKLRAVKFGRNWMTTKEWLEEYLLKVESYKNGKIYLENQNKKSSYTNEPSVNNAILYKDIVFPKKNIAEKNNIKFFARFAYISLAAISIVLFSVFAIKSSNNIIVKNFSDAALNVVKVSLNSTGIAFNKLAEADKLGIIEYMKDICIKYADWSKSKINFFAELFKNVSNKLTYYFKSLSNIWSKEKSIADNNKTSQNNDGLVVVPSSNDDESLKEKIKVSFSDEVNIEPTDNSSGYVIPIFKEGFGEKYMYMLVPVN